MSIQFHCFLSLFALYRVYIYLDDISSSFSTPGHLLRGGGVVVRLDVESWDILPGAGCVI